MNNKIPHRQHTGLAATATPEAFALLRRLAAASVLLTLVGLSPTVAEAESLPTYTLERVSSSAAEGARAQFKLRRTGRPAGRLIVRYSVSESGAMIRPRYAGAKYVSLPSILRSWNLYVPTVNDGVPEAHSVVTVTLEAGEGYQLGSPHSATVTVEDDDGGADLPKVTVERLASPVEEGADARFRIRRAGGAGALRVRYSVSESGAMVASGEEGDKTVAFPDGGAQVTVTVPTVEDGAQEADSVVTVTLEADAGADPAYLLGDPATADVTVEDDDNAEPTGEVTISDTTPAVGDTLTADASGIVDADGLTGAAFTYQWMRVSGGGETNISGAVSATYTVVAEDVGARLKAAVSYTDDDGALERVESAGTAAVVTDDGGSELPTYTLERVSSSWKEGESVRFELRRMGGKPGRLKVRYSVSESGAMIRPHYAGPAKSVSLPSSLLRWNLYVPTVNDGVPEADSVVTVTLEAGEGYELGSPHSATVTVRDDDGGADLPEVTVERLASPVEEGADARFRIRRAGGAGALRVRYRVSENGAMVASGQEGDKTVAFPGGGAQVTVTVPTVEDGAQEADSVVTVTLEAGEGYELGSPHSADVTVEDDDNAEPTGRVTISDTTPAVGDTLTADASGIVDADGLTGAAFAYQWMRVSGGGETNISGATSATYTVVAEDVGAKLKVAVSYTDDDGALERVESAETAAVASGLSLLIADANTLEGDTGETELAFTVSVVPSATGTVAVDWATSDVTAEAGTDYRAGSGTLTFNTGETERTVAVRVRGDRIDEPNETFRVRLSNASGAELRRSLATGTIRDDDAEPRVVLALSPDTIGEAGGVSVVTASLSHRSSEDTTVTVSAAPSSGDYALSSNRLLRIPAGETESAGLVTVSATSTPLVISATSTSAIIPHRTVTVSGTAENDLGVADPRSVTLAITGPSLTPFLPPASAPGLEGFVRVLNHAGEAGEVSIEAIDAAGVSAGTVTLPIAAKAAAHFNAMDLEEGNPGKGFAKGVGAGQGGWRLVLRSALPITALAYVGTDDGLVAPMYDVAPFMEGGHHVAFFNPASNLSQMSSLRLVNLGGEEAEVAVVGTDDAGVTPDAAASVTVPAGGASDLTAGELEAALGDGAGKWRLAVRSDEPVLAMSLLASAAGHLTNLSTVPAVPGDGGAHVVPFFPSASDTFGRRGFVRVANRSAEAGEVIISAHDDSDFAYEAVTLAIGAGATAHFNSDDLELGGDKAEEKGLTGSTGSGVGDWRLELASALDLEVLAYVRMSDGVLASMHDVAPVLEGGAHWVAFFNPADNLDQASTLRLVNPGTADAAVTITGIDDQGARSGGAVVLTVPAGASRTLGAAELESGADGLDFADGLEGALGDGSGKWRLRVVSDQPILVMSLLASPGGYLTNLSSAPGRGIR